MDNPPTKKLYSDNCALILENEPDPVIQIDFTGKITYLNPAAITAFPEISLSRINHPIFGAWESVCKSLVQGKGKTITREIENDHKCYEEKISYSKNNGLIHIYLRDITDKKQTVESLVQQLIESQALLETSQLLSSSLDLPTILQHLVDAAAKLVKQADQAVIHLIDEDEAHLLAVAVAKPDIHSLSDRMNFRPGEGVAGIVIASGISINITNASRDPRYIPSKHSDPEIRSLLVAPIKSQEKSIGTLSVHSINPGAFSPGDERLLTTLGNQAGEAIGKAWLLKKEREQRLLSEALNEIAVALGTTLDFTTILDRLLDQIDRVVPYDAASVMLIEGIRTRSERMRRFENYGDDLTKKMAELSFNIYEVPQLKQMFETGKPSVIADILPDSKWAQVIPELRSWAGTPILAQGRVIAFFSLHKKEPDFYTPQHIERLSAFAGQAALTIQNAQLFETTQRRLKEVNTLYQISQGIAESLERDQMLERVTSMLQGMFGYYHVQVYLVDEASGKLFVHRTPGASHLNLEHQNHILAPGEGIVGNVAYTGHPFVTNNLNGVAFHIPEPDFPGAHAELAVPIRTGNRLIGVLDILLVPPQLFTDHDLRLMTTVADQLAVGLEKASLYSVLQAALRQEQMARVQLVQAEKLAALGRIVASVAHELNNPLQAIQNALFLVKMEEFPNSQTKDDLETAIKETARMAELITRLRETYRPTTNEEFQSVSINDIVMEVHKLINTHLRHNNIVYKFDPEFNLPSCLLIRDQIKQVLLNICLNAVETMPDAGYLTITTRYDVDTNGISIKISDTGPGIDAEVLPYVFDPFVTTKEGGTGLGLAISYDIIRHHMGKIEVESKPGKGTTFFIWLPLKASDRSNESQTR